MSADEFKVGTMEEDILDILVRGRAQAFGVRNGLDRGVCKIACVEINSRTYPRQDASLRISLTLELASYYTGSSPMMSWCTVSN